MGKYSLDWRAYFSYSSETEFYNWNYVVLQSLFLTLLYLISNKESLYNIVLTNIRNIQKLMVRLTKQSTNKTKLHARILMFLSIKSF